MALKLSQFEAGAIEQGIGFGLGALIGAALEPISQDQKRRIYARIQSTVLDAGTSAQAVLEGSWSRDRGLEEAKQSGVNEERFNALMDVIDTAPGLSDALDLLRRGEITPDQFDSALKDAHLNSRWFAPIHALRRVILSAADLAMARQQGFVNAEDQIARSEKVGVDQDDANLLYELSGLPPGIETAMEMLRRNIITEPQFVQMVREGHTKTKYTDDLLKLVDRVPSVAAAVQGAIRERISIDEAAQIAAQNGFDRKAFDLLYEIAGRPIGVQQAVTLYYRGDYTLADVRNVVARSNVRPEFTEAVIKLGVRYPPLFQISRLIQSGAIDDTYAKQLIAKQGYPVQLAEGIVKAAHTSKTAHLKDLSVAVIETLYDTGLETSEHAVKLLEGLGYDADESKQLLNIHDARRYAAEMQRAATIIRNKYVGHAIDRGKALAQIGELAGTAEARDRILKLWDLEREANVHVLTPSEIGQAVKYNIITDDEAIARWVNIGYSEDDAHIKLQIVHKGPDHPAVGTVP